MEVKGRFPPKIIRRSRLTKPHFNLNNSHELFVESTDDSTGQIKHQKVLPSLKPTRTLKSLLISESEDLASGEVGLLVHLTDLLEKCLELDPDRRITPNAALSHPFLLNKNNRS